MDGRLTKEAPIPRRAKVERPLRRLSNTLLVIVSPCFEKQDARAAAFGKTRCNDGPARARSADDEVEFLAGPELAGAFMANVDLVRVRPHGNTS
jgi:hypothetical protein